MFRNDGGKRFQDVTTSGGFGHLQKGHGVAFGDLDNDGDQDIYEVMGGAYRRSRLQRALREPADRGNHWISLELEGRPRQPRGDRRARRGHVSDAVGTAHHPSGRRSGGSFGASTLRVHVGLGDATSITSVAVRWPRRVDGGSTAPQVFTGFEAGKAYRLKEDAPAPVRRDAAGDRAREGPGRPPRALTAPVPRAGAPTSSSWSRSPRRPTA